MSLPLVQLHPLLIRMYDTHNTGLCELYLPTPIHTCGLEVSALAEFYVIKDEDAILTNGTLYNPNYGFHQGFTNIELLNIQSIGSFLEFLMIEFGHIMTFSYIHPVHPFVLFTARTLCPIGLYIQPNLTFFIQTHLLCKFGLDTIV